MFWGGISFMLYAQINLSDYTAKELYPLFKRCFPTSNALCATQVCSSPVDPKADTQWEIPGVVFLLSLLGELGFGGTAGWFSFGQLAPLDGQAADLHLSLERSRFSSTLLRRMLSNLTWFSRCSSFSSTPGLPRPPGPPRQ